jgi:membrane fusion protein, multidrug efflux system
MTRWTWTYSVCLLAAAALATAGCLTEAKTTSADPAASRPPIAVSVIAATASDLTETVDVVGSLVPKFSADVKSEVTGVVTAVYVTDWVPVTKGAALARLDSSETEAAIEALKAIEAQARVVQARARREHERALQLKQYGLITDQALDDARTALDAADAAVAAARAQTRTAETRLAKLVIKSPIDGIVAERHINPGDRVENMGGGEPMFRLVDTHVLELVMTVPSQRTSAVRVGQVLRFETDALPGRPFTGRITFINPVVDQASRSARVTAAIQNADGMLRGGYFVRGSIVTSERRAVVQVPRETLLDWNTTAKTAAVFVVDGGRVEKRIVTTGAIAGGAVEISNGLSEGESIVARGGFALKSGDKVTVAAGGGT